MKEVYALFSGAASASLLFNPTGSDRLAILTEVAVHPDCQGRGWGSAVLKEVCADADREGITLLLSVDPGPAGLSYTGLVSWYERQGFVGNADDDVMVRFPFTEQ